MKDRKQINLIDLRTANVDFPKYDSEFLGYVQELKRLITLNFGEHVKNIFWDDYAEKFIVELKSDSRQVVSLDINHEQEILVVFSTHFCLDPKEGVKKELERLEKVIERFKEVSYSRIEVTV